MAAPKPLAVRMLEQRKIPHEVFEFDDSIRSAQEVARVTGTPSDRVLKTLVVEQDPPRGKPFLVMMPASLEVDLKVLAASLGLKKLRMASHRDAEQHTGLRVGGISALALLGKGFPVLVEESATVFDDVLVSAGQRGWDVRLAVTALIELTGARPIRAAGSSRRAR
jgi:Cys-tRNA(Pro)/Cys-tRNA(Cys) deacylase